MDRQRKVRIYEQKIMRFGTQELKIHSRYEEQFHFDPRQQLDSVHSYLIVNIWNIPTVPGTTSYKIVVINALTNYFVARSQKARSSHAMLSWLALRLVYMLHGKRLKPKYLVAAKEFLIKDFNPSMKHYKLSEQM